MLGKKKEARIHSAQCCGFGWPRRWTCSTVSVDRLNYFWEIFALVFQSGQLEPSDLPYGGCLLLEHICILMGDERWTMPRLYESLYGTFVAGFSWTRISCDPSNFVHFRKKNWRRMVSGKIFGSAAVRMHDAKDEHLKFCFVSDTTVQRMTPTGMEGMEGMEWMEWNGMEKWTEGRNGMIWNGMEWNGRKGGGGKGEGRKEWNG